MFPSTHLAAVQGLSESTLRAAFTQLSRQRPSGKRTDPEALWITARLAALTAAIRGLRTDRQPS